MKTFDENPAKAETSASEGKSIVELHNDGYTNDMQFNSVHSNSDTQIKKGDVVISEDGKVIKPSEGINSKRRLFMKTKNGTLVRLKLHDPQMDQTQLFPLKPGTQLVRFLSKANVNWILDDSDTWLSGLPIINSIEAAIKSEGGSFDYGVTYLMENLKDHYELDVGSDPQSYGQWDTGGGFIMFEGRNEVYNIPDAGNFLWGAEMARNNLPIYTVIAAAQTFTKITTSNWDSKADQDAIRQGHQYYIDYDQESFTGGYSFWRLIPYFNKDKKPKWFK